VALAVGLANVTGFAWDMRAEVLRVRHTQGDFKVEWILQVCRSRPCDDVQRVRHPSNEAPVEEG
jgi:hypothetical protein